MNKIYPPAFSMAALVLLLIAILREMDYGFIRCYDGLKGSRDMGKFNNGKPYHGSEDVMCGKLKGATAEGDYFYFFCPKCKDDEIMRLLEYAVHAQEAENPYNVKCKSKAKDGFTIVFKLHCEKCGFSDFVKVSNTGWQGGKLKDALERY